MSDSDQLLDQVQRAGMLLQHDAALLSVTSIIATTPIAGSWWSHPQARQMYALITALADHRDVLVVKLVRGKATFLHRWLWPALLGVASAHDDWQLDGLSDAAHALYAAVERHGVLQETGAVPKELERRLLVQSEQQHTERGHHAIQLMAWRVWAERVNSDPPLPASVGRAQLEAALGTIGGRVTLLPWGRRHR